MVLIVSEDRFPSVMWWALLLFVIAAFTDFLDGYLARRWSVTTVMGAFLDSTADKLLVTGAFLALIRVGRASIWVALIIIVREFIVMALRGLAAIEGELVRPSIWGKLKATVQFIAIGFAIIRLGEPIGPLYFDEYLMWLAAAITLLSGWDYVSRFWATARRVDSTA